MKWTKPRSVGLLLLGIWLIASGVLTFVHITSINTGFILAALAIAAGIFILLDR